MFYGILGALLTSLGDISLKKSTSVSLHTLSNYGYQLICGFSSLIVLAIIFGFALLLNIETFTNAFTLQNIIFFFIIGFINIFEGYLFSYAFHNEKIAILTPYEESETVFTVLLGFILFSNVSIKSFVFAMIAGIVLIIGGLDFKNLKFNKYTLAIMFGSLLNAIKTIVTAYLLIQFTPLSSLFYSSISALLIILLITYIKKELKFTLRKTTKTMSFFIGLENIMRLLVGFVYANLITEVGVIQTTLLGLLTIFSNMIFGYFMFKEVPVKKDYIIAFLVIVCIVFGTTT